MASPRAPRSHRSRPVSRYYTVYYTLLGVPGSTMLRAYSAAQARHRVASFFPRAVGLEAELASGA